MKMRTALSTLAAFTIVAAFAMGQAEKPLTNNDVVQLAKAGLQESLIIKKIQASATEFDLSPARLVELKGQGVGDRIIETMIAAQSKENGSGQSAHKNVEPELVTPESKRTGETPLTSGPPVIYVEEVSTAGGNPSSDTALEAIRTLQKKGMRVTTIKDKADYVLQITRQLGKHSWRKDTKIAVVNRAGEVVFANSTRSIGGAMGDVVDFINKRKQ